MLVSAPFMFCRMNGINCSDWMIAGREERSSQGFEDGCVATVEPSDSGCLQPCLLFFGHNAEGSEHFAVCVVKVFLIDLTETTEYTFSCSPHSSFLYLEALVISYFLCGLSYR